MTGADSLAVGRRVRVTDRDVSHDVDLDWPDHKHPQAGVTGVITEFFGVNTEWGRPRAMIRRDDGSGFIIVSVQYLEKFDG